MEWFDAKTNPPKEEGQYLCVSSGFNVQHYWILGYTNNLESVNEYDFQGNVRPGWYEYDSEYGHYEVISVTHWMPLPELPDA